MIRRPLNKTILFADIGGSSALYKAAGNLVAKNTIDSILVALRKITQEHKGKVIKDIGDEIMTCFDSCAMCVHAAAAMQYKLTNFVNQHQLTLSIGIGFGEVIKENSDLFGEAVNDAAFLTNLAKGGQILITKDAFQQLDTTSKAIIREFDKIKIKGAEESSVIYRVFWQGEEFSDKETRLMSSDIINEELNAVALTIEYEGSTQIIDASDSPFIIGRDPQRCDLLIDGSQVSREHCKIEYSRGKFVLIDHSTNGCYLSAENKDEFYIRREEYPLVGSTILSLGLPIEQAQDGVIKFSTVIE
ncbi:adenylate/guanylate cyclase domain-containing protein [Aliikangiella coralliicola]|uniref:Adenylate/guanylate cyclase domain-containing protein n=1 Tax=Aliikangiella coralliicola TaxID=2592383 RepID=A0A545UH98_9GAMM|nr:adenylate/guanylate cyclase domain-containing protein [Aliikangiella coralliicola]TQV88793.1 adenylate/guanylate cyclase domain-containing protein [Aliikangiella coralliicola]